MQVCTVACGKAAVIASGKPFKPSVTRQTLLAAMRGHNSDQDVLDPTVLQLGHHRQPEFGTFIVSDLLAGRRILEFAVRPKAENLAHAVA